MARKTKTYQQLLDEEKNLRAKGIANDQVAEMVRHMQELDIPTAWDVQPAYDADFLGLKDRCHFGSRGLCCRNCAMGPCRLEAEDMPHHMKVVSPKLNRSTCGKTHDSMVASMLLSEVIRGTASHLDHAFHVIETFHKAAEGNPNYSIKDEVKLKSLAKKLGVEVDERENSDIALDIAHLAYEDMIGRPIGEGGAPMDFFMAYAPKNIEKVKKVDLVPKKGAAIKIMKAEHSTSQGMMSSTFELLREVLKLGLMDNTGLFIATELQDILLGTPQPTKSRIGFDVLKKDMVNIVVHGHVPTLSSKVVEYAGKLERKAKQAGAKGINVVGVCCTGNELLMREGIPLAGNNLHQELVIGTGIVDAFVVDVQCVYPGISTVVQQYHTKLVTTVPELRMENELFIPFREEYADRDATRIIEEAIEAYKARKAEKIFMPSGAGFEIMAGFSTEGCIALLSKINPEDPLKPLVDLIKDGSIQGAALLAGCTSPKIQSDMNHVIIAKELLKNNVLVIATGCAAGACGRNRLLMPEGAELAGDSLKKVLKTLGEVAGLPHSLPPVWHMGSCVDNSRVLVLVSALADYLGVSVDMLPVAASAAEYVTEKAMAIGTGAISLGITTHLGVIPKVGGSPFVVKILTQELEGLLGSRLIIAPDPYDAAGEMLEHIQSKRKALGI